jgi:hypothetical protein
MTKESISSSDMIFAQSAVGAANENGRTWFIAEEGDEFRLLQYKSNEWFVKTPDWPVVSICGTEKTKTTFEVIALGMDGELLTGVPGGFSESDLQKLTGTSFAIGPMRDIRVVGDDVFAAGMGRQVFRRANDQWALISSSIHSTKDEIAGFNSIHGRTPTAVFAVGFEGEIWFYNGSDWKQLDNATSVVLHRVVVAPNGFAIICGAAGVLLQANSEQAVTIKNQATEDNLYGLTVFKEKVFVSSMTELFELTNEGLQPVSIDLEGPLSFGHLEANEKYIWSVGAQHLLRSEDGVAWQLIKCDI